MQVKTFSRYILLKADIPTLVRGVVAKDVNVGGIKLQYEVSTIKACVFQFLNKQRIICLTLFPKDKETRTFLNPYKELWDSNRNRLPKSLWGSNNDALTQLWIELESDYKNLDSGVPIVKQEIRNTNITKHFSKARQKFFVFQKQ